MPVRLFTAKNTLATFLALTGAGVLAANMNARPRAEEKDRKNGESGFALRGCERSGGGV
jgi:predicted transposase YbfD/YdcC